MKQEILCLKIFSQAKEKNLNLSKYVLTFYQLVMQDKNNSWGYL